jgi:hypothetical protein
MAFQLNDKHNHFLIPQVTYEDGVIHHVIADGARFHTPSWDSNGAHCSEKDCEVNHGGIREYIQCPSRN